MKMFMIGRVVNHQRIFNLIRARTKAEAIEQALQKGGRYYGAVEL